MIVVAGGTGRLGTLLVRRLAARGLEVKVLTRDAARARHLSGVAAEIVDGDVRDRASLASAVRGATTVVSAVQGFAGPGRVSPGSVDRDGNANLAAAALAVDADMVLLSVVGASPEHPMELFRAKWAAEQQLRASGVRWTIVRATAYVELWAEIMAKPIVFGRGENPINFVSAGEVAAVVERSVISTDLRGEVLEVGGPQNITFNELAELVQQIHGRSMRVRHVPRWLLRSASPFSRRACAAVAMDRFDMTFDAAGVRGRFADVPTIAIEDALSNAIS